MTATSLTSDLDPGLRRDERVRRLLAIGPFAIALLFAPLAARAAPAAPSNHAEQLSEEGEALYAKGDVAAAHARFQQAVAEARQTLGADAPLTLDIEASLAVTTGALGDRVGEERMERDLLARQARLTGPGSPESLLLLNNLAQTVIGSGRPAEGETLLRQALDGRRKALGPSDPLTLDTAENMANLYGELGRYPEQEALAREIFAARAAKEGAQAPATLRVGLDVFWALDHQGRTDDADAFLIESLLPALDAPDVRDAMDSDTPRFQILIAIGEAGFRAILRRGAAEQALDLADSLLTYQRAHLGERDGRILTVLNLKAVALEQLGRNAEAEPLAAQIAADLTSRRAPGDAPLPAEAAAYTNLGAVRADMAAWPGAYDAYRTAALLTRHRYGDRRVSGDSDDARQLLIRDREVFIDQLHAGWAWAHMP